MGKAHQGARTPYPALPMITQPAKDCKFLVEFPEINVHHPPLDGTGILPGNEERSLYVVVSGDRRAYMKVPATKYQ